MPRPATVVLDIPVRSSSMSNGPESNYKDFISPVRLGEIPRQPALA